MCWLSPCSKDSCPSRKSVPWCKSAVDLLEISYRELLEETGMQKERYDVVVVGAGIVGCAVSYHLAKSGLKVALLDKGGVAGEASQAAAGMLAPLGNEPPDQAHPLQQLGMAALRYYDGLDEQLKQETGIDIGLVKVPTLRPAFDEQGEHACKPSLRNSSSFSQGFSGWRGAAHTSSNPRFQRPFRERCCLPTRGMFRLHRSRWPMRGERSPAAPPLLKGVPLDGSSFKDSGRLEWKPRRVLCMRRPLSWQRVRGPHNGMRVDQPRLFSR